MIRIRFAELADVPQICSIYETNVFHSAISFEVEPPSQEEMARRLSRTLDSLPWLVCRRDDEILGYVYAGKHRERAAYGWCVDVTVYIRDSARRQGVARGLYFSLFAILRLQGYHAAHAGITLPNPGSVGLHESLGFRPIGVYPKVGFKNGAWHDVGWWQLELAERTAAPAALSNYATLPRLQEALETGLNWIRV